MQIFRDRASMVQLPDASLPALSMCRFLVASPDPPEPRVPVPCISAQPRTGIAGPPTSKRRRIPRDRSKTGARSFQDRATAHAHDRHCMCATDALRTERENKNSEKGKKEEEEEEEDKKKEGRGKGVGRDGVVAGRLHPTAVPLRSRPFFRGKIKKTELQDPMRLTRRAANTETSRGGESAREGVAGEGIKGGRRGGEGTGR